MAKKKTARVIPRVPDDDERHITDCLHAADPFNIAAERDLTGHGFETVQWVYGENFHTHSRKNIYTSPHTIEPHNKFLLEEVRVGGSRFLMQYLSKVEVVVANKVYLDCVATPFVRAVIEPKPELEDMEGPARLFFNVPLVFSFRFPEGLFVGTAVTFQVRAFIDDFYAGREGRLSLAAVGWKRRPLV